MESGSLDRRSLVAQQFHHARRQAQLEELMARLTGQSASLLSYDEVARALRVRGKASAGLQTVPVAAIIGSVGRYNDFTRSFLPLHNSDESRWVSVRMAANHVSELPPLELYRLGESYFVLDGNHRVSIARQNKVEYIEAQVTDIATRVPLPKGASPDALIVAAEYAAFLEATRLDTTRADVDLTVSVPGQYSHLESYIDAYRYLLESEGGIELSFEEAAARWYDEAYLPLVEEIRFQGILQYFPGRTETDFFVWLAAHRAALQAEFGITLTPEATVSRLLGRVRVPAGAAQPGRSRLQRALGRLSPITQTTDPLIESRSQALVVARYSDRLFADILVPIDLDAADFDTAAFHQALALANSEGARLGVLGIVNELSAPIEQAEALERLGRLVSIYATPQGIETSIIVETGEFFDIVARISPLYEIIVVDRQCGCIAGRSIVTLIDRARRPIFIAANRDEPFLTGRVAVLVDLAFDRGESLFAATYLAEQHHLNMILIAIGRAQDVAERLTVAQQYVEMHEIAAETVQLETATGLGNLMPQLEAQACGLLVVPGVRQMSRRHGRAAQQLMNTIDAWPHSLLVTNWG